MTIISGLLSGVVLSQPASVYVDIGPCMDMEDDAARYACYDLLEEQIRASQARESQLPVVSIPRNSGQAQAAEAAGNGVAGDEPDEENGENGENAVSEFGLDSSVAAQGREANARILENENGEEELIDTIASLEEKLPNQWQVSLSGGQIWSQVNSKRYRLREGMEVRIYPSPFGSSFRLSATNLNGFIQVRRIQ